MRGSHADCGQRRGAMDQRAQVTETPVDCSRDMRQTEGRKAGLGRDLTESRWQRVERAHTEWKKRESSHAD